MSNKEVIYEAIKGLGPVSANELMDYMGFSNKQSVYSLVSSARKAYPDIEKDGRLYFVKEEKEEKIDFKNQEGYPDPTAHEALNNIAHSMMEAGIKEEEKKPLPQITFDVHTIIRSTYPVSGYEYFFILSQNGPYIWCVPMESMHPTNELIPIKNRLFGFDVRRTPFTINIGRVDESQVKNILSGVAKTVGLYDYISFKDEKTCTDDINLALLRQEAEIYKDAFYAVCGARNPKERVSYSSYYRKEE